MSKKSTPPELSGLSRSADRKVLEILAEYGDDLSRRRHTILFFYRHKDDAGTDPAVFQTIINDGATLGFRIASHRADALIIEGHKLVDPDNLEALSTWAEEIADAAGVTFDGWECAVDDGDEPS